MNRENMEIFENKKIKIFLKSGKIFTGKIVAMYQDCFYFEDKFNMEILITFDAVSMIEVSE